MIPELKVVKAMYSAWSPTACNLLLGPIILCTMREASATWIQKREYKLSIKVLMAKSQISVTLGLTLLPTTQFLYLYSKDVDLTASMVLSNSKNAINQ